MAVFITRRQALVGAVASAAAISLLSRTGAANPSKVHEVRIKSFRFDPEHIQVRLGDVIRWTNRDLAPHTATADEFGWDTEKIARGSSADVTVTEGMETRYSCAFHPQMKGSFEILR
jgi:plastocyanin